MMHNMLSYSSPLSRWSLLVIFMCVAHISQAQVYKCVDKDNKVLFSQTPCATQTSGESMDIQRVVKTPPIGDQHEYRRATDLRRNFKCDTLQQGMAVLPSRASLVALLETYQEQAKKPVPPGYTATEDISDARQRSICRYHLSRNRVQLEIKAGREADRILMADMLVKLQLLGYPVKKGQQVLRYQSATWREHGYRCSIRASQDRRELIITCTQ